MLLVRVASLLCFCAIVTAQIGCSNSGMAPSVSIKLQSRSPTAAVLLCGIFFIAVLLLWPLNVRDSGPNTSAALWFNYEGSLLYPIPKHVSPEMRVFNMSFPGFITVCNDSLPTAHKGSETLATITHRICCDGPGTVGSDGQRHVCRIAHKQLQIPVENELAIRASGARAIHLNSVDFVRSFVFVTGASRDHFSESLVQLNSLQKTFPCTRVIYWDLGLQPNQAKQLQIFCGVEYRRFNFSKYPPHVATLKTYAFKPLVLMESFMEHPVLWWVDASIRFTSDAWRNVVPLVKQRHGLVFFRDYEHSIWSATYPQTYEYLATDVEMLKRLITISGASFIAVNTPELFSTVLYWFYACSLDARCLAPIMYPEPCNLRGLADFANCHRFDQSVLTIIAANVWGFNSDGYRYREDFFSIKRDDHGDNRVKKCSLADFENTLKTDVCRRFPEVV